MRGLSLSLLALALLVAGCGKKANNAPVVATPGACAKSTLIGKFTGTFNGNPDTLSLNDDCTATELYCGATFTYEPTTTSTGAFNYKMSKVTNPTNDGNCFNTGDGSAMFSVTGNSASFDFGGSYSK